MIEINLYLIFKRQYVWRKICHKSEWRINQVRYISINNFKDYLIEILS